MTSEPRRPHSWIRNAAFTRLSGFAKVCLDCRLALEPGERLDRAERYCPGKVAAPPEETK